MKRSSLVRPNSPITSLSNSIMTSSQHLILFDGYDEEEELPAIGSRIEVSELRNLGGKHVSRQLIFLSASLWIRTSGWTLQTDAKDFGLVEVSSLTEEQVKAFKQRGLFQTPILSNPQDLKIELARGKVEVDIWVFQASANADLDRFKGRFKNVKLQLWKSLQISSLKNSFKEEKIGKRWIGNKNGLETLMKTKV